MIGLFERVVSDFGAVLDEVDARFGTAFNRYDASSENKAAVFTIVEEMNRRECRGEVVETQVGRPSAQRSRHKEMAALLEVPRTAARLREADRLHERYARLSIERAAVSRRPTSPG